jgi:hypothetical protein
MRRKIDTSRSRFAEFRKATKVGEIRVEDEDSNISRTDQRYRNGYMILGNTPCATLMFAC